MRLSCPGCGAVYEAPLASVGPAGRLVECGACGRRWRAFSPAASGLVPAPDDAALTAAVAAAAPAPDSAPADPGPPPNLYPVVAETADAEASRSGGAFMAGFALVATAALIAVVVYARHEGLAAAAPALTDPLAIYAEWVDARRAELREAVEALRARIDG
jgi:predicted Zn finger-like uncharacterized protein